MISLITCVYNDKEYLKRCFDSIIKQTFSNFEVIVVNDGSSDDSQKVIDEYLKIDTRFRSIVQNHSGQAVARNKGIEEAKGEYIVFVDSDDELKERYLLALSKAIDNNCDFGYSKILRVYDNQSSILERNYKYIDAYDSTISNIYNNPEAITRISNSPCAKIFRRKFLLDNNIMFYPGRLYEDMLFIVSILLCNPSTIFIDDDSYIYHVHNGSSMTGNGKRAYEIFDVFDAVVNFAKNRNCYDYYYKELEYLAIYHIAIGTMYRRFRYKPFSFFESLNKCKSYLKKYNFSINNVYVKKMSIFERIYLKVFFSF